MQADPGVNDALVAYLTTRRTVPAPQLTAPGPDRATLDAMLTIAARVPDHGKLAPWRFVLFDHERRQAGIPRLMDFATLPDDEAEERKRRQRVEVFAVAPIVVGVLSSPVEHPKIPLWEQQLSAAAVCFNLVHAAHAYGFSAQWLTDWFTYDGRAARFLGARNAERFAGFVHIGTPALPPVERDRPDVAAITTVWREPAG